ncbi:MAG: BlaI/MecI/CopY family transcriptional regulator [Planctomycetota bacterium]
MNLNENETEALRILWECGELKPSEIEANFGWDIENATLRSVLRNLVEKELVARRKEGKAFVYRARKRKQTQFAQAMQRMAEVFTGGSKAGLIMELLRREKLSPTEVEELKRIAGQLESESNEGNSN